MNILKLSMYAWGFRFVSRRLGALGLSLFLSIVPVASAQAELIAIDVIKSNWINVLGGAATTIAAHELGHFVAAEIEDVDAYFDGITIAYRETDGSDRQGLRLSSAGYQAQWLASEIGFMRLGQQDLSAQQRAWNAGLVIGQIGITAAYLTFLKNHEEGDALGVAQALDISTDKVVALLAIPAMLDGWRLFGRQAPKWAGWTSRGMKAVGVAAVWQF